MGTNKPQDVVTPSDRFSQLPFLEACTSAASPIGDHGTPALLDDVQAHADRPPLPLTTGMPVLIDYTSGGLGGRGHRQELGVYCVDPPQRARSLIRIQLRVKQEGASA